MNISPYIEAMLPGVPMALVTSIGFCFGLYQYKKAQRWKRREFVAAQIKLLEDNQLVRRAMFMLDFRQGSFKVNGQEIFFDDKVVTSAIASHDIKPKYPTPEETQIRLAFCDFFEGLERLHHFVESKLISVRDLEPYLPYWIRRFASPELKDSAFIDSAWTFVDTYEYTGVRKLASILAKTDSSLKVPGPGEAKERVREWFAKNTVTDPEVGAPNPAAPADQKAPLSDR